MPNCKLETSNKSKNTTQTGPLRLMPVSEFSGLGSRTKGGLVPSDQSTKQPVYTIVVSTVC